MNEEETTNLTSKLARAGGGEGALLHFLLENIPVKIYFKDTQSRFIRVSRSMAQLFGLKSGYELIGKTDFDLFTKEHAMPAFADEQQVMRTGIPITDKIEKETTPDGEVRWAMTTKMPLRNAHGEIVGTCGISQDATTQKRLEEVLAANNRELLDRQQQLERALAERDEANKKLQVIQQQLVEAEKMQALGRLAYGVAHEIRNPLNILQMGMEFLSGAPVTPQNSSHQDVLQEMKAATRRANEVIDTLIETTSPSAVELESCNVRELLDEALAEIEPEATSRGIIFCKDLPSDLPSINADRAKMKQVFHGIITNAVDAMPHGGEITIRAELKHLGTSDIKREAGSRSAERFLGGKTRMLVEVEDTGAGIAPEVLTRIFDPFFTTKEPGHGPGLGLTVCRKLLELHRGSIQVNNRTDCSGAIVSVLLPLTA